MSRIKPLLVSAAAVVAAVFAMGAPSSCSPENWLDPDRYEELQRPPQAKISIHPVIKYRHGAETEMTIPTYSKREVTVSSPWLTSREIEKVQAVPRPSKPGYYDLEITLTQKGRREWIMLSNAYAHEEMAFVIDGVFYRGFRPRRLLDENSVLVFVDGPFDPATAKELAYHSEFNYMKLNDK